jgi:aspartate/methionine/tyrosine aminotransferase
MAAAFSMASRAIRTSARVLATDEPVIVKMGALLRTAPEGSLSLAQGVVHWPPPEEALRAARDAVSTPQTHLYCADAGLPELRAELQAALARDHGLTGIDVMVTAGANQAFLNSVLVSMDAGDSAVVFAPYYFNHLMALQMCGHAEHTLIGPAAGEQLHPDLDWLEKTLKRRNRAPAVGADSRGGAPAESAVKLVVLCTPCNPTGVNLPKQLVGRVVALCEAHGCFLFLDHA